MPLMAPLGAGVPSDFGLAPKANADAKIYPSWVTQAISASADVVLLLDNSGSGAGAFVDSSGNGHHLTPNTTIVNGTNMLGANQALADSVFDFSTGLAQATSAYDVTKALMSMGIWVKPLSLTASGGQLYNIVMSCATAGNTRGWDIGYRTNGVWTLIFAGVAVYEFNGPTVAAVGTRTHFMVVLRPGNIADLYLDGYRRLRVSTGSMLLGSGTTLTINSYPTNGGNYQGKFEAEGVEIYRYSLTDDQVFQSFNAGITFIPDAGGPVTYFQELDASLGSSVLVVDQAQKILSSTVSSVITRVLSVSKVLSTTSSNSISKIVSASKILLASSSVAATISSVLNRIQTLSTSAGSSVLISKLAAKLLSSSSNTNVSSVITVLKNIQVSISSTPTMVRKASKVLSMSASAAATVNCIKVILTTISATSSSTATMIRQAMKTLGVSITTQALRVSNVSKSISSISSSTPSIQKIPAKTLSVVGSTSVMLVKTCLKFLSTTQNTSVSQLKAIFKILSSTAPSTLSIAKVCAKNILVSCSTSALMMKRVSKNLSVSITNFASVAAFKTGGTVFFQTLSASAPVSAIVTGLKIAGSGIVRGAHTALRSVRTRLSMLVALRTRSTRLDDVGVTSGLTPHDAAAKLSETDSPRADLEP